MLEPNEQLMFIMTMNTLGLSIVSETFKAASKAFISSHNYKSGKQSYAKECYAFVQGTGLDMLLMDYGLNYDAESLRESFNYYMRHRTS